MKSSLKRPFPNKNIKCRHHVGKNKEVDTATNTISTSYKINLWRRWDSNPLILTNPI